MNQKGPAGDGISWRLAGLQGRRHASYPSIWFWFVKAEKEIGSPHFGEVVGQPKVMDELKKCIGVFMPSASQDRDGSVQIDLGAKGVVELELVSSGEKWGRGPKSDVHSSLEATVDSPTWHLVQALNTLVGPDGHKPAVTGFFNKVKPLTPAQLQMIKEVAAKRSEDMMKQQFGVTPLVWRQIVLRCIGAVGIAAYDQHRRLGRRIHRTGRQDCVAASSGREG